MTNQRPIRGSHMRIQYDQSETNLRTQCDQSEVLAVEELTHHGLLELSTTSQLQGRVTVCVLQVNITTMLDQDQAYCPGTPEG